MFLSRANTWYRTYDFYPFDCIVNGEINPIKGFFWKNIQQGWVIQYFDIQKQHNTLHNKNKISVLKYFYLF